MSIVTEYYKTRSDGVVLNRTYSDAGFMIERDGMKYREAIDPEGTNRTYTETDEPVKERPKRTSKLNNTNHEST